MPRAPSLLSLALLGACNQVFGLEPTQSVDARYFDAPPSVCPALGSPPAFDDDLRQVLLQNCTDYTVSANGHALARCSNVIEEGPVDGALAPALGLDPPPNTTYLNPRLGPDGASAVIRVFDKTSTSTRVYFATFTRSEAGTWSKTSELTLTNPFSSSSVSRDGHILVTATGGIHELATSNGTWTDLGVHSELGVTVLSDGVALSADGLRMMFVGQLVSNTPFALLYADRPTLDAPFSQAVLMPAVEYFPNAFLTADCARLYTWALGTVFYVTPAGT
jgi:hypothetical protein